MTEYFLLLLIGVPMAVFVISKRVNALFALFFVLYFQGIFSIAGFSMGIVKATIEALVWLFFLIALFNGNTQSRQMPGFVLFILFTIFYLVSVILNKALNFDAYSYYRHYLNGFLLMGAVYMYPFAPKKLFSFNKFIFNLFLLQIFASFVKFLLIGQYEEYAGTMIITNGSINTIFPLIAIIFMMFAYLYMGKKESICWPVLVFFLWDG